MISNLLGVGVNKLRKESEMINRWPTPFEGRLVLYKKYMIENSSVDNSPKLNIIVYTDFYTMYKNILKKVKQELLMSNEPHVGVERYSRYL